MTEPMRRQQSGVPWTEISEPYGSAAQELDVTAFAARFSEHYLCFVTGSAGEDAEGEMSFMTLCGEHPEEGERILHIAPLVKRAGANPFTLMVTFGRAPNNDIQIPVGDVSKFHGYFSRDGAAWAVTDAGSTNGTFLDGSRLKPRTPVRLELGQPIGLASIEAKVVSGADLYHLLQPQSA